MSDSFIRTPPDSTGKLVDTESLTTGSGTVQRQRVRAFLESGEHTYGEQPTVAPGATATLVTFAAPATWRFVGFLGSGEGDGLFFVQYDATTKYVRRTNIAEKNALLELPAPDPDASGAVVTLKVKNEGTGTSQFEGTLVGVNG